MLLDEVPLGGSRERTHVRRVRERIAESKRKEKAAEGDPGVLAASGMIAGEGLAGVAIAFLIAGTTEWPGLRDALAPVHFAEKGFTYITGVPAIVLGVVIVIGVCALLFRAGRRR